MKKRVKLLFNQSRNKYRFCKNGAIKESYDRGNISYLGSVYIDNLYILPGITTSSTKRIGYNNCAVDEVRYTHYPPPEK